MADGSFSSVIEEHPAFISLAVLAVALLAYFNRGSSAAPAAYTIAGAPNHGADPGAVAIEQSAISAGQANVSTLAQLVGLEHTNDASLAAGLAQTGAARDVGLAQVAGDVTKAGYARDSTIYQAGAARDTAIFQAGAARDVGLAGITAAQEVADQQTGASVTISGQQTAAQVQAAQITASSQSQIAQANATAAAQTNAQNNQTQKDIARAGDNTSIVNGVVSVVGNIVGFLASFL